MTKEEIQGALDVMDVYMGAFKKAYTDTQDINLSIKLTNGFISAMCHKPDEIDRMDGLNMTAYEVEGFKI